MQTLYTRDSLGNLRSWRMEVDGNRYRTISGLVDGEQVQSEWTVVREGKNIGRSNATTAQEQAQREVEARYTKQLKTGYTEAPDGSNGVASYVEPMLAKSYEDYRGKLDFSNGDWLLNIKYNGLRAVATKGGLHTRKGERFVSVPHIERSLKKFFDKYPDAVLDGELFNENYRQQLNEIVKLARKTKNVTQKDLESSEKLIEFYVYDGYGFDGMTESTPYETRFDWISNELFGMYEHIGFVPHWRFYSPEQMDKLYTDIVSKGHEGAILRYAKMPYEHKRSKNLLKLKPVDDAEFVVVDINEGTGNWSGKAKIISLRSVDGKLTFDASFKGTMEQAEQVLRDKDKWLDKVVTICYNGLTGLGTPQFAQFDINNCIKGDR